jgi:hypothetical protein
MSITNYDPEKHYPTYSDKNAAPCAEHWEKWVDEQDADPRLDGIQNMVMVLSRKTLRLMLEKIPEAFVSLPPYTEEEMAAKRMEYGCAE